jgi:uncharacterized protein YidB (DUF937 family)
MGLLDSVLSGALSNLAGGAAQGGAGAAGGISPELIKVVVGMLGNDSPLGGLGGLIGKFQNAGLGDVASSWVSNGENMPVSPNQIQDALGSDTLGQIASQLGMSHGDAAGSLSQMLPQIINQLTPQGQAPAGGLGNMGDLLGALLGGQR